MRLKWREGCLGSDLRSWKKSCPRATALAWAAHRIAPKSERTLCASKRSGLVRLVVGHRFVDEAVKFPRGRVGFNLSVPNLGVEVREPFPELREFLGGEALDQ